MSPADGELAAVEERAAEDVNGHTPEPPGSPLAALRARLAEKQLATTEDIPLPGVFEDELAVRYRALPYEKAKEIQERDGRELDRFMDELIHACDCILYRKDGKWEPLLDDGRKVRFDKRLATALEIPDGAQGGQPIDTRVVLRGVFALAAGGRSPEDADRWEEALVHADHLIDTTHTLYRFWLKGGGDMVGAETRIADDALGE